MMIPSEAQAPPFAAVAIILVPVEDAQVDRQVPDQCDREHSGVAAAGTQGECLGLAFRAVPATKHATVVGGHQEGVHGAKTLQDESLGTHLFGMIRASTAPGG
jgi:hypothetical protein